MVEKMVRGQVGIELGMRIFSLVCMVAGCTLPLPTQQVWAEQTVMAESQEDVVRTLVQQHGAIMAQPGVIGTGLSLCDDNPCIKVIVQRDSPELRQRLQQILGGHRFVVEESEPVHMQSGKEK